MIEIQVLAHTTQKYSIWSVDRYTIIPPIELISLDTFCGIDPGTSNAGMARLYSKDADDRAELWQIKITRDDDAIKRMNLASSIVSYFIYEVDLSKEYFFPILTIIEGASFGNNFRQVELAEQRATFVWRLLDGSYEVKIIPPTTIRKAVFGSGKIKAHEAWQLAGIPKNKQPNDALTALSCAYYEMMKGE